MELLRQGKEITRNKGIKRGKEAKKRSYAKKERKKIRYKGIEGDEEKPGVAKTGKGI